MTRHVVLLLLIPPLISARFDSNHLRAHSSHSLTVEVPRVLALLGKQKESCQCTFEDECSCKGAMKFMDCIKSKCNSGDCMCIEDDGTNHFVEACNAMGSQCSGLGMKCAAKEATCNDRGVAFHSKLKERAASKKAAAAKEKPKDAEKAEVPKKYVMHTKYKAKVAELHSHSHRVFAQGVITTIIVLSVTIALASSSNDSIKKHTWSTIDFVVVTFLALAWFAVLMHMVDYYKLSGVWAVLLHMFISVISLFALNVISWRLKQGRNEKDADVFAGIFTPMVMWFNAGFVETLHQHSPNPFNLSQGWFLAGSLVDLVIWYAILFLVFYHGMKKLTRADWNDDNEAHMAGGALAGAFMLWLHAVISGSYQTIEDPHKNPPNLGETLVMNVLSVVFLLVAVVAAPPINTLIQKSENAYWRKRALQVVGQFLSFLPRFSFVMSLAHLILSNFGYDQGAVAARLHLALVSTAIGVFLIFLCSKVNKFNKSEMSAVLIGLGGFMIGVAWSGLLDNSINMMIKGKGYGHPFEVKLFITGLLTAFVFPMYYCYLKPLIDEKTA